MSAGRQDNPQLVVVDSITRLLPQPVPAVVVCGSHAGSVSVRFALAAGVRAVILNDAGFGKDNAGISGLEDADEAGVPAAAVSHLSARIGDGYDTIDRGIISAANTAARTAGVELGQTAADAATTLAATQPPARPRVPAPPFAPAAHVIDTAARIVALDSASQIDVTMRCWVAVTGSHGGAVGGTATKSPTKAAIFNDAGVGRDKAGISRLALLDNASIPAATVSHDTARIGEGLETYESGIVSFVNEAAARAGVAPGDRASDAATAFAHSHACTSER